MAHPYRQQLSNSLGENINVVPIERNALDKTDKNFRIRPHQILADQMVNLTTKKSHPFLKNLPEDVSRSLESLHLSSTPSTPKNNKSFDSESPNSKDTSMSSTSFISNDVLNGSAHSSKQTNTTSNGVNHTEKHKIDVKTQNNDTNTQSQSNHIHENKSSLGVRKMLSNDPITSKLSAEVSFDSENADNSTYPNLKLSHVSPNEPTYKESTVSPIHEYFEKAVHQTMAFDKNIETGFQDNSPKNRHITHSSLPLQEKKVETNHFFPHNRTKSTANLIHPVLQQMSGNNVNEETESAPESRATKSTISTDISSTVNHLPLESSIEMYRKNAKKTKDPQTLFMFAQVLIKAALMKDNNLLTQKEKEKYIEEAHIVLKKASKAGLIDAQYYLGDAFSVGLFSKGKPDLGKSLTHFESAGKARHPESAYRTAMCYKKGWGCTRDARKVAKYLEISAMNKHPVAMMEYGIYAFHGLMSFPDDINTKKMGISWLRRATECATELSCGAPYELALIYINGFKDIVIKDTIYAIKLLFKAANLGHAKSAAMLGKFYEIGDVVEQNPDLSIHFYNMSANLGDVDGMMGLCSWYFVGSGNLPQDYDEAFAWALRAAELKNVKAMLLLEKFYSIGMGCEKDINKAKHWGDLSRSQDKKKRKEKS